MQAICITKGAFSRMNALQTYLEKCPTKHVPKGTIIVLQDEIPECAYGVKHGTVRVYNVTANGEEKSLAFSVGTDIFPVCWIFAQTDQSLFYYQAYTDCELYIIDRQNFIDYLKATPELAYVLLAKQVEAYVSESMRVNALSQAKASAKLLATLRHLCLRHGNDIRKDHVRIQIPLTQQEIANMVGLTRETTVVELNKLKESGVIAADRKYYTVNTSKLNELIDDDYNPGIVLGSTRRNAW